MTIIINLRTEFTHGELLRVYQTPTAQLHPAKTVNATSKTEKGINRHIKKPHLLFFLL